MGSMNVEAFEIANLFSSKKINNKSKQGVGQERRLILSPSNLSGIFRYNEGGKLCRQSKEAHQVMQQD